MITRFKLSSILLLLTTFVLHAKTETLLITESDAEEEEEKKLDVFHGNESLSTLPPDEDSSSKSTLEDPMEFKRENAWWENESNSTDYDEFQEEKKNDASPENSVDRDLLESVNDFLPDPQPDMDTSPFSDFKRETSQAKSYLLSSEPHSTTIPDLSVLASFTRSECSFGDRNCVLSTMSSEIVASKPPDLPKEHVFSSFPTTPLVMVKSMKLGEDTSVEISLASTSIQSVTDYTTATMSPLESTTTAQTSDNLILVEDTDVRKDESVIHEQLDKSGKSEQIGKEHESASDEREEVLARTFMKTTEVTPFLILEKESVSSWDESNSPSTLLTKFLSTASTAVTNSSVHLKYVQPSLTISDNFPKVNTYIFPETPLIVKELESDSLTDFKTPIAHSTVSSIPFPTVSWRLSKHISPEDEDKSTEVKHVLQTVPILTPSFSASPAFPETEVLEDVKTSFSQISEKSNSVLEPSMVSKTSAISPVLKSQFIPTITDKETTTRKDRKQDTVPPPRLTNPGCSSLPVCVEITLLETTWEQFCADKQDFQEFLSKSVSHYTRPIHPYHIVLDTEICALSSALRPPQNSPDVAVAFYVTNDSGEYEERMTEICGVILRKWAPSSFKNSIMEVRLYNSETLSTTLPVIPELNSGFVAAVSISAVAGVALCLLCILLVIMKQKLIQGRNSDTTTPTADAYSLDSLSISASFRRRRMRRSARSYLNHAFNDQEIPSHPLNEKTLANCLKNKDLLEEEYKRIPMTMPKLDSIPDGAHAKNRYSNILPKAESRVMLADPSGDPLKCYINANYVKGYEGKSAFYIACQAPLPEGIEDFWRMVWEQQCRVIIMLTMFEENGTSRCAVYFPQSTLISQQPFGDFQVSLLKKDVYEFYTLSTLRLLDLEKNLFRDVVHLWFTAWPDVGVPKDPSSLVTFVQQCRPFINCNSGPTVVHCSTGTGRTGAFLALDICMREYDESRSIDILQCVSQLRRDRAGAVQNKDQYFLIHEAMLEYISRMVNQAQRPSICS